MSIRALTGTQHLFGSAQVGVMAVFTDDEGKKVRLLRRGPEPDFVEILDGGSVEIGGGRLTVDEIGLPQPQPAGSRPMPGWAMLRWEERTSLWD